MYQLRLVNSIHWLFCLLFISQIGFAQELSEADRVYLERIDSLWNNRQAMSSVYNDAELRKLGQYQGVEDESVLRERMRYLDSKSPMDLRYNAVVGKYIERYVKYSASLGQLMGLAEYYYPMFEEKLDKYDIPLELKHLAVVESRLNPRAVSPVGAKGLWQFMYPTGKMFNLDVNSYVDERYDPVRSTEAACRYLKDLYNMFGSWDLALAAYNSGPGNVRKAISRSGGSKDYWVLRQYLPRETAGYVPAFIAANYIMNYSKAYNITPVYPKYTHYNKDTVVVQGSVSFRELSSYLDIPMEDLQDLNPMYNRGIVPYVPGKNYSVTLPKSKIDLYEKNKKFIYKIEQQNPILNNPTMETISRGGSSSGGNSVKSAKTPLNVPVAPKVGKPIFHTVRAGESLEMIANMYSVTTDQIISWNNLTSRNSELGKNLAIYGAKTPEVRSQTTYKVKQGDNLYRIAKENNVSVQDLMKWNGLDNPNSITVGRVLKLK